MQKKTNVPVLTVILIAINILVYIYVSRRGSVYDTDFMLEMGAIYEPLVVGEHQWYRLVTHFFLHYGWDHLFNNMISLLVLGYAMEQVIGRVKYLFLYFLSGILAGVTSIVYNVIIGAEPFVSCGASGAIYGLMGALLVLLVKGNRGRRSSEVPRYLLYLGISLYSGFQDVSIDAAAHAGGFVAGFVICLLLTIGKRMEVTYES